ncbi:uncharacterized protein LOC131301362 isoform X1 [Rhododendron vialii]|uniref:uncharacterized protein LOC131301362 isoform X1 n=1 Tax=Rhododendron vialii TaxID=182163 RepID=UPI00265F9363|nr:uncharacterized protein LOC131301362 isoform X1 [Rhododendron vialii]
MNPFKIPNCHHQPPFLFISKNTLLSSPHFLSLPVSPTPHVPLSASTLSPFPPNLISISKPQLPSFKHSRVSKVSAQVWSNEDKKNSDDTVELGEDLAIDGAVFQKTLRLVECSMFAAVGGLAYFLSTSLSIESYFGCFFALPILISSLRWGVAAGRKTMVATAMLLLVLSGPVKALTYLDDTLSVDYLSLAAHAWFSWCNDGYFMEAEGKLEPFNHFVRICRVRALGAVGCVLITSFLIRENILALITVNIHASLSYIVTTVGINAIPSMDMIYLIFGTLVVLNCGFFVFLLHILYALFFIKFGMKASLKLPRWLEKAI